MPYTTREGDQWDAIAKEVYGRETHADHLMKANMGLLEIFTFGFGTVLETPPLPAGTENLPPWRE